MNNYSTNSIAEKKQFAAEIKAEAKRLGFEACGIVKAEPLYEAGDFLLKWLEKNYHAGMKYMENNFEKRVNPTELVEGTESIIVVLMNYFPPHRQKPEVPQVAQFAYSVDYHYIIKSKLTLLLNFIQLKYPQTKARAFVDSAPVFEKILAQKAGLGWIGKNTMLINKNIGSHGLLGELFVNIELETDDCESPNFCGNCNRCIAVCPSGALEAPFSLNSNKCISYFNIENKDEIPENIQKRITNQLFGCDECMKVCPYNRFAKPTQVIEFKPINDLLEMNYADWAKLTKAEFRKKFKNSSLNRIGYNRLMLNLKNLNTTE